VEIKNCTVVTLEARSLQTITDTRSYFFVPYLPVCPQGTKREQINEYSQNSILGIYLSI